MNDVTMPFGKHKGKVLSSVPRGYIRFILANMNLREPLRGQLNAVVEGKPIPPPPDDDELIAKLFDGKR